MNASSKWNLLTSLAVLAGASCLTNAVAQETTPSTDQKDEPVKLERFVVTGSYIPFAADATAIPVRVVTSEDIQTSGESGDLLAQESLRG